MVSVAGGGGSEGEGSSVLTPASSPASSLTALTYRFSNSRASSEVMESEKVTEESFL